MDGVLYPSFWVKHALPIALACNGSAKDNLTARQNVGGLGFADSRDERMGGDDEIARMASITSLTETAERVVTHPYDAGTRAFRLGIRPANDLKMLHV